MKYVSQLTVIMFISFLSEALSSLLPLPVPASIYGLIILLTLLLAGVVREEQIQEVAEWLLAVMPVFFIPPTVSVMTSFGVLKNDLPGLLVAIPLSTVAAMAVTGMISQAVIRTGRNRKGAREHE